LLWLLRSEDSRFKSIAEIAKAGGLARATLSKALLNFRDAVDFHLGAGKLESSRESYRKAQLEAVENGTHGSYRKHKTAP
jgi:hypothetical protein